MAVPCFSLRLVLWAFFLFPTVSSMDDNPSTILLRHNRWFCIWPASMDDNRICPVMEDWLNPSFLVHGPKCQVCSRINTTASFVNASNTMSLQSNITDLMQEYCTDPFTDWLQTNAIAHTTTAFTRPQLSIRPPTMPIAAPIWTQPLLQTRLVTRQKNPCLVMMRPSNPKRSHCTTLVKSTRIRTGQNGH